MKEMQSLAVLASVAILASPGCGQGTFQNLGFESVIVVRTNGPSGDDVVFAQAFPGWTGYIGTSQAATAVYNGYSIGSASISLVGRNAPRVGAIEGNFSVLLQAGIFYGPGGPHAAVSLRQTGQVPADAQSVQFKAIHWETWRPFAVSLDGQDLVLVALQTTPNYTLFGADVSAFAGHTRELRFTAFTPDGGLNNLYLDSITFSPDVIPQPIPLTIQALGSTVVLRWTNAAFALQVAPAVTGSYTNVPGAVSPWTNAVVADPLFFRLRAN